MAAGATLAAILGLAACGDDGSQDPGGPDMTRVAWARVYQHGGPTLPHQTTGSIGRALARLEPTWVTGLVRLEEGEQPTGKEVSAYHEIRDAVHAKSPKAEFDIELNALEYKSAEEVQEQMRELREKFDNDGWFFDFFTPAYDARPEVVKAAISEAHDNGEWVGGNTFGWSRDPDNSVVPSGSDYLAVADDNFKLDVDAARKLAERVPLLFHLRNNPDNPRSEGCIYINHYTTREREAYIRHRAQQQAEDKFRFAYPVFFPTCLRSPNAPETAIISFDSIRDRTMPGTIAQLMRKYNSGGS